MANKPQRKALLSLLKAQPQPLTLKAIAGLIHHKVPERTLRRWLADWVDNDKVLRTGAGRATCYQYNHQRQGEGTALEQAFGFLDGLDADLRAALLGQLRDLWTHTSTALEGNTLSLGDTHFILEQGLTISGKPIKDHQEVLGHARAIELLYQSLSQRLTEEVIFDLHRAVQTEVVRDIYKPMGAWKKEINGTYAVGPDGRQLFIEYAMPIAVPKLMAEVIGFINALDYDNLALSDMHTVYAKIHMGIAHIHPFWDGNGRIARLLANIPLLKSGLPPLIIPQEERLTYIKTLSAYQLEVGQLNNASGVWPQPALLKEFGDFCQGCYQHTQQLLEQSLALQKKRQA